MAALGWNLGGTSGKKLTQSSAQPALSIRRPPRAGRSVRAGHGPTGEAAERLAAIRNTRDSGERMRATIDFASTLSPSEFAAWMDGNWFSLREGADLTIFSNILLDRWKQEDPEGLALWQCKLPTRDSDSILASWAESDPQRLLDFFKKHPDQSKEIETLSILAKNAPALALQRLLEMVTEGMSAADMRNSDELLKELAKQSPADLEAALASLPGELNQIAEVFLIGQKMESSYSTELRKLWERPDGLDLFLKIIRQNDQLGVKLLPELANLPGPWRESFASNAYPLIERKDALTWVNADLEGSGFTEAQAQKIRASALSNLISSDPQATLKLMIQYDLPGESRQSLISSAFAQVRDEPEKIAPMLALLDSAEEREYAKKALEPRVDRSPPEIDQPAVWLEKVATLDSKTDYSSYDYISMLSDWDAEKRAALTLQFKSLADDKKLKIAGAIASYGDVNTLRGEALSYLVAHPTDTSVISDSVDDGRMSAAASIVRASEYVVELGQKDPAAACDWIQSLPDGQPKLWALRNLRSAWTNYDPKAAEQWFQSLPARVQAEVQSLKK